MVKFFKKIFLVVLIILINSDSFSFAQDRYIKKSITYIPFLLKKEDYDIESGETNYILDTLRNAIEMKRFDYNPEVAIFCWTFS